MALSEELISEFVKVTNDTDTKKNETTLPGTVVKSGDVYYVRLDGSDCLTPISSTVEIEHGDRVNVLLKNHDATVVGNLTKKATALEKVTEVLADGSLEINAANFVVNAGGTVNINGKLVLSSDGKLSLNIDSLSIGDSESIDNLDDLKGKNGSSPEISENGNWILDGVETEFSAIGDDGHSPYIEDDGYWYEWDDSAGAYQNTGIKARGPQGPEGASNQYVKYYTTGSYAGLNLVTDAGLTGLHTNVNNASFRVMNDTTTLAKFGSGYLLTGDLEIWASELGYPNGDLQFVILDSSLENGTVFTTSGTERHPSVLIGNFPQNFLIRSLISGYVDGTTLYLFGDGQKCVDGTNYS